MTTKPDYTYEATRLQLRGCKVAQNNAHYGWQHNRAYVDAVEALLNRLEHHGEHELVAMFRNMKPPVASADEFEELQ